MSSAPRSLRTFDLFCGAGGSSWGAAMAGAEIVGGVDVDEVAMATYADNFPEAIWTKPSLAEDISPHRLSSTIGPIDLLLASPECTNHTHARGARPRDELSMRKAHQVVRYAAGFEPRWIAIENVVNMANWDRYEHFIGMLESLGYHGTTLRLNSSDFGVPQARRRLFMLFDRERQPPCQLEVQEAQPQVAADAVDLEAPFNWTLLDRPGRALNTLARAQRAIDAIGEDRPFLIVYYGTDKAGGWQPLDVPLRTITTVDRFGLVKWIDGEPYMRMLQVPELSRAMGFEHPLGDRRFRLDRGSRRDRVRLIGNAVCPPVMASVVAALTSKGQETET